MNKPFIICAYYTPGIYEEVFNQYLKPSLDKLNLPRYTKKVDDLGNWSKNTSYKPQFALECLSMFPEGNIVLLDVDATINEYPQLFTEIPTSSLFAFHRLDNAKWYQ